MYSTNINGATVLSKVLTADVVIFTVVLNAVGGIDVVGYVYLKL